MANPVKTSAPALRRYYDCNICNARGMEFSDENLQLHFNSPAHKHMAMFYDQGMWPGLEATPDNPKIYTFLDDGGTVMCQLCQIILKNGSELLKHQHQPSHLKLLIDNRLQHLIPVLFACDACNIVLRGHDAYFQHNASGEHQATLNARRYEGCSDIYSGQENTVSQNGSSSLHNLYPQPIAPEVSMLNSGPNSLLFEKLNDLIAADEPKSLLSTSLPAVHEEDYEEDDYLNLSDKFTRELVTNIMKSLKSAFDIADKSDLLIAAIIKNEQNCPIDSKPAADRQARLTEIALACKNRQQNRRIGELGIFKRLLKLLEENVIPKQMAGAAGPEGTVSLIPPGVRLESVAPAKNSGPDREQAIREIMKQSVLVLDAMGKELNPPPRRSSRDRGCSPARRDKRRYGSPSAGRKAYNGSPSMDASRLSHGQRRRRSRSRTPVGSNTMPDELGSGEKAQCADEAAPEGPNNAIGETKEKSAMRSLTTASAARSNHNGRRTERSRAYGDGWRTTSLRVKTYEEHAERSEKYSNFENPNAVKAKSRHRGNREKQESGQEMDEKVANGQPADDNNGEQAKDGGKRQAPAKTPAWKIVPPDQLAAAPIGEWKSTSGDQVPELSDELPKKAPAPKPPQPPGSSLNNKIDKFFGANICSSFLGLIRTFRKELPHNVVTWNDESYKFRQIYRDKLASASQGSLTPYQMQALSIIMDMKLDFLVRRYLPRPPRSPYYDKLKTFKFTATDGSMWLFDPSDNYYRMREELEAIEEQMRAAGSADHPIVL